MDASVTAKTSNLYNNGFNSKTLADYITLHHNTNMVYYSVNLSDNNLIRNFIESLNVTITDEVLSEADALLNVMLPSPMLYDIKNQLYKTVDDIKRDIFYYKM